MKIVVEEGQAQSPADPSEQPSTNEYAVDLDYEGALSLLRRLRSSGSYIHFEDQNYRIQFRLDPDDPIEVEIMSIIDDFWATSGVDKRCWFIDLSWTFAMMQQILSRWRIALLPTHLAKPDLNFSSQGNLINLARECAAHAQR